MMNGSGKSDRCVVPAKLPNKAPRGAAEAMEGRRRAKGNSDEQNAARTPSRSPALSALDRIRQAARRDGRQRFTALLHHVYDVERLRYAYFALKRTAAAGVDGQTWKQYGEELEGNLRDLSDRLQRGAYRAKPARRTYIAKADGRQRPLGVPALEDKLVQRAVVEVLNAIYEQDFLGFSYGFRPQRNPHQALDALAVAIHTRKVNWVLDADIRAFFDTLDHGWLVKFVEHRIGDRRIVRLIQKWLKAGVLEEGQRISDPAYFPSGMKALSDYCHSKGAQIRSLHRCGQCDLRDVLRHLRISGHAQPLSAGLRHVCGVGNRLYKNRLLLLFRRCKEYLCNGTGLPEKRSDSYETDRADGS